MQVNKRSLSPIIRDELIEQFEELGAIVIDVSGDDIPWATQFTFGSLEHFGIAVDHASTYLDVKEYGIEDFPSVEDFSKPGIVHMLEVWFNEQTMDPVEEMLHMAQNGKENVILGAFVSADGTYPIFVTRVVEISR